MNLETYNSRLEEMKQEEKDKTQSLKKEYALANSPYNVGDVITDGYKTIKIEKIVVYLESPPTCVYKGTVLTKKGEVAKRQDDNAIYQSRVRVDL